MNTHKTSRFWPVTAAIVGNVIWGYTFLFTKMSLNASAVTLHTETGAIAILLAVRFIISAIIMAIVMVVRAWHSSKKLVEVPEVPIEEKPVEVEGKKKPWWALFAVAAFSVVYFFLETACLNATNSTFTGVALAIVPVYTIATGAIFLREWPSLAQCLLILVPIIGVVLITISGKEMGVVDGTGLALVILTSLVLAFSKTVNRYAGSEFSAATSNMASCLLKAIVFPVVALMQYDFTTEILPVTMDINFLWPILVLAATSSVIADTITYYAASRMPVMELAGYGAVSTLVSAVVGVIFLKEPMSILSWVGAGLVIVGVWLLTQEKGKKKTV